MTSLLRPICLATCLALAGCVFDGSGQASDATTALDRARDHGPLDVGSADGLDARLADSAGEASRDTDTTPPDLGPCGHCDPALGCHASGTRCNRLQPSSLTTAETAKAHALATTSCNLSAGAVTIDGEAGTIDGCPGVSYALVDQTGSKVKIAVFALDTLQIGPATTVTVTGRYAVLLYARGDATIDGLINVAAQGKLPGPGGLKGGAEDGADGAPCDGGQGQGGLSDPDSGGGGAGWGQAGGAGGGSGNASGGAGGSASNVALIPLCGGCGGGAGGGSAKDGGAGGAGGGALELAVGGTLRITGGIDAGGGGGSGGKRGDAGGGGGSGGTLLLEAPHIAISGLLSANGGGGAAGATDSDAAAAEAGQDGTHSTSQAAGGQGLDEGGNGSAGGALTGAPVAAPDALNGGGGGGGAGRILLSSPDLTLGSCSPAPTPTTVLQVW